MLCRRRCVQDEEELGARRELGPKRVCTWFRYVGLVITLGRGGICLLSTYLSALMETENDWRPSTPTWGRGAEEGAHRLRSLRATSAMARRRILQEREGGAPQVLVLDQPNRLCARQGALQHLVLERPRLFSSASAWNKPQKI